MNETSSTTLDFFFYLHITIRHVSHLHQLMREFTFLRSINFFKNVKSAARIWSNDREFMVVSIPPILPTDTTLPPVCNMVVMVTCMTCMFCYCKENFIGNSNLPNFCYHQVHMEYALQVGWHKQITWLTSPLRFLMY